MTTPADEFQQLNYDKKIIGVISMISQHVISIVSTFVIIGQFLLPHPNQTQIDIHAIKTNLDLDELHERCCCCLLATL